MNKSISFIIFLLMIIVAVFAFICYPAYSSEKDNIAKKLLFSLDKVVELDKDKRFKERDVRFLTHPSPNEQPDQITMHVDSTQIVIEKREDHSNLTDAEKQNHAIQTYLFEKNPIKVAVLDSFWRIELSKQGFLFQTAVAYTNNITKEVYYSHPDSLFYASADTIAQRVLGVRGEITLQVFATITPMTVIRQSLKMFVGIILRWIFACILFLFFAFHKKKEVVVKEEEPLIEELKDLVSWNPTEGCFYYNNCVATFPPKVSQCFDLLWNNRNEVVTYIQFIDAIHGSIEFIDGKKRLKQYILLIRNKLKSMPIIEISTIDGCGYKLIVHDLPVD